MRRFFLFLFYTAFCLFDSTLFAGHPFEHPKAWADEDGCASVLFALKNHPVEACVPMRHFLADQGKKYSFENDVFLVTFHSGLRAVFKPVQNSTLPSGLREANTEVVAFNASKHLGLGLVPPTVIRWFSTPLVPRETSIGSLQVYVETDCDLLNPGVFEHVRQNVSSDHFSDLQLFCFVMGQWDTGVHNLLAIKENPEDVQEKAMRLIAIDNAGIANMQRVRYGQPAFVCVSDPSNIGDIREEVFPFADALVMTKPDHAKLREALLQCVPPLADDPLVKAMRFYGAEPLHYVVWKGALWRQFHGSNPTDEGYLLCKADTISDNMKSKLQGLNLKTVRDFFPAGSKEALGEACFEDLVYYVLKRRDQVLAFL